MGRIEQERAEFVSFGIDPGDVSGWSVATCPEIPVIVGKAETLGDRRAACLYVKQFAGKNMPIVVAVEDWTIGGPRANYKMFKSLGKSSGRWLEVIEEILGIPEKEVLRPVPQKWRNGLFTPKLVKEHQGGDKLKRLACAFVSPEESHLIRDHNAAEAGCIACWVQCSEEGMDAADRAICRCAKARKSGSVT